MLPQGSDKGDVFFPQREPGFRPQVLLRALLGPVAFHLALIPGHSPSGSWLGSWGAYLDPHLVNCERGAQPFGGLRRPSTGRLGRGPCGCCAHHTRPGPLKLPQAPAEVSVGLI